MRESNLKDFKKDGLYLALVFLVIALVISSLIKFQQNSRVCASNKKLYTNNEVLIKVMGTVYDSGELKLDPQDTSIEAYLANHPDCCYVQQDERWLFNLYGLLDGVRVVPMKYALSKKAIEADRGAGGGTHYEQVVYVDACLEITRVENRATYNQ